MFFGVFDITSALIGSLQHAMTGYGGGREVWVASAQGHIKFDVNRKGPSRMTPSSNRLSSLHELVLVATVYDADDWPKAWDAGAWPTP